tara:strand:+ start:102 stop:344 length:243 start_codon:yes stop_codon:yes gene_type:complete
MNTYTEETIEIAHSWKGGEKQTINKEDYIKAFTSHMSGFTGLYFGFGEHDEEYYHEAKRFKLLTANRAEQVFDNLYKKQS